MDLFDTLLLYSILKHHDSPVVKVADFEILCYKSISNM